MAINLTVYYNGVFLPDILLLTQAPLVVWFDGIFIIMYCAVICFELFGDLA